MEFVWLIFRSVVSVINIFREYVTTGPNDSIVIRSASEINENSGRSRSFGSLPKVILPHRIGAARCCHRASCSDQDEDGIVAGRACVPFLMVADKPVWRVNGRHATLPPRL